MAGDLDLAFVALGVFLKTHSDTVQSSNVIELRKSTIDDHKGRIEFYTSINEISQFLDIDRATVRRKMQKLAILNVIQKVDVDKWCWLNTSCEKKSPQKIIFEKLLPNYIRCSIELSDILSEDDFFANGSEASEVSALSIDEVLKKVKRGFSGHDEQHLLPPSDDIVSKN